MFTNAPLGHAATESLNALSKAGATHVAPPDPGTTTLTTPGTYTGSLLRQLTHYLDVPLRPGATTAMQNATWRPQSNAGRLPCATRPKKVTNHRCACSRARVRKRDCISIRNAYKNLKESSRIGHTTLLDPSSKGLDQRIPSIDNYLLMQTLSSWDAKLHSWGYKPLFCSVDHKIGLEELEDILKGQTTVIVGPSGVGKSSLINALRRAPYGSEDEEIDKLLIEGHKWLGDQRVGSVSKRTGRGKHTTRHVSLLPLDGEGFLADTPGFNQPSLLKVTKKSLAQTFPEIRWMINASEPSKCTFNNCLHLGEPGCIVKGDWERYPYYLQLLDEIKIREEIQRRTLGTKRESDVRYKMTEMGVKQAEPRLQPKKHRRVSRKRLNQSILDDLQGEDWSDIEESAR
ncbi:hypothetical protein Taro_004618 [Colocasia esculenta]|uniref:EngC GTPase domain-containing protein n=1 Tax=Colocasia esculenta TaxID=4460 RepID=A0A843TS58_COLES|nr:hypothetical protein [Colocasia esculenta]